MLLLYCDREKGYEGDTMSAYALVAGMQVSGCSLGAMTGPPIAGAITQTLDYPWNQTMLAFVAFGMVSDKTLLLFYACCQHPGSY